MGGPTLSRFTPSVMSHDLLERLFVARDRLLDEIMRRIASASSSPERHHTLLVGPRGAGKTHLVSLVYHRVKDLAAAGTGVQVAWLPEDPWTIVSYRHLLAEVASRLEPSVAGEIPRSIDELERLLATRAEEGGPIVVIVENLDQILRSIEDDGQQRLRHLLQADRSLLLVATTTVLDRSLSDQAVPFYSFFTSSRLEPFDVAQATEMLRAIAHERGDEELVEYLAADEGQARLRTIEHLAGGQPRMWAALASALTVEGLDDLVDLLLTRFDDLTPYYQEQLGRLSGQQRLVVAELAEVDRPITVKELSERLELDQRSLGKTVSDLVERRWMAPTTSPVTAMLDQRRTYYELAEPMARLSFQIKDNRGEPLRVVVDFLKHWFDPEDLESSVEGALNGYLAEAADVQRSDAVVSVARRLGNLPRTPARCIDLLAEVRDALDALRRMEPERFLALPSAVRAVIEDRLRADGVDFVTADVHYAAMSELGRRPDPRMETWTASAEELVRVSAGHPGQNLYRGVLIDWKARSGLFAEADAALDAFVADVEPARGLVLSVLVRAKASMAMTISDAGDRAAAASRFESLRSEVEEHYGPAHEMVTYTMAGEAVCLGALGRYDDAISLLEQVVERRDTAYGPWDLRTLTARSWLATQLLGADRFEDVRALVTAILELIDAHPDRVGAGRQSLEQFRESAQLKLALAERLAGDAEAPGLRPPPASLGGRQLPSARPSS